MIATAYVSLISDGGIVVGSISSLRLCCVDDVIDVAICLGYTLLDLQ